MKKTLRVLILIITILLIWTSVVVGVENNSKINVPILEKSEEFKQWEQLPQNQRYKYAEPIYGDINFAQSIRKSTYNRLLKQEILDTKYNIADSVNMIVKDQKKVGACWAFAYSSVVESLMAKKNNLETVTQISPMHVDYKTANMYSRKVGDGGSLLMALSYTANGYGPVYERDLPFESVYNEQTNNKDNYYLLDKSQVTLNQEPVAKIKNVQLYSGGNLPEQREIIKAKIKEHIKEHGAVMSCLYVDFQTVSSGTITSAEGFFNPDTFAYYCNDENKANLINHAVTIVGWNDEFEKENFTEDKQPTQDGAWIALNSYGSTFGNTGYFYISYEDVTVLSTALSISDVIDYNPTDSQDENIYQYDELGMSSALVIPYTANVFTRESNQSEKDEYLNDVGIELLMAQGVEIYVNPAGDDFSQLTKVAEYTGENALEAGYHTIKLPSPVKITGDKFIVAVRYISDSDLTAPIECNLKESGLSIVSTAYDTASSSRGESYASLDGLNWYDFYNVSISDNQTLQNSNACIKAITTEQDIQSTNVKVTGVTIDQKNVSIQKGSTVSLSSTITPTNATNKNVTWASSNENVATVTNQGIVTAVSEGTANITVTTEDGGYTATCSITVTKKTDDSDDEYKPSDNVDDNKDDNNKNVDKDENEDDKLDDTVAEGILPYTGNSYIIISIFVIFTGGIIAFIKYRKVKDIK